MSEEGSADTKQLNEALKWLALLAAGIGSSMPGITFFTEYAPPLLEGWSLLVTALAIPILFFGYFRPFRSRRLLRLALVSVVFAVVLLIVYSVLLNMTTVRPPAPRGGARFQVGWGKAVWGLQPAAREVVEADGSLSVQELMLLFAGYQEGGPEKIWKVWVIVLFGVLLTVVFVTAFFLWTYGFALLAQFLSVRSRGAGAGDGA